MLTLNNLEIEEYIRSRTESYVPTYTTTSNNGTLTITSSSTTLHFLLGSGTNYSVVLPNATTLQNGTVYRFYNRTTSSVSILRNDNSVAFTVQAESFIEITLQDNSTSNGLFATTQIEVGQASGIVNFTNESTTNFVTTSTTDVQITGMTLTPISGKYLAIYDSSNENTTNNSLNTISIYRGSTQVTGSERTARATASNFVFLLTTQAVVDLDGTQAIGVRIRSTTGTLTVGARSLVLIRLSGVS